MSFYTGMLERVAGSASAGSAALFASLSALRGKRFFHPVGETYRGTVTFADEDIGLPFSGTREARVRLSRGAGLPGSLPDVFGFAVKLPELGHDFLLASSGDNPVTRHLLLPAAGFFSLPYSSVLPYELDDRLVVFGARADHALKGANSARPEDLASLIATGKLRFDLTVAFVGNSDNETFGSLVVDAPHEGDIDFNPWNCLPPLRPAGPLNRLRRETYEASQATRRSR
ncbi:MAG: hypothetical protein M3161_04855 [Actinomycetota bacterium]|nr:hypothetical protein [Actinomycetota bacterium]